MKLKTCLCLIAVFTLMTNAVIGLAHDPAAINLSQPDLRSDAERFAHLEKALDRIREELKIPALSVAIVKDQRVVWAKGLGYADLEQKIPARAHLLSPRLVDQDLRLDAPDAAYTGGQSQSR